MLLMGMRTVFGAIPVFVAILSLQSQLVLVRPGVGQFCGRREGLSPSRPSSGRKVQAWAFELVFSGNQSLSPAWHFPGALAVTCPCLIVTLRPASLQKPYGTA